MLARLNIIELPQFYGYAELKGISIVPSGVKHSLFIYVKDTTINHTILLTTHEYYPSDDGSAFIELQNRIHNWVQLNVKDLIKINQDDINLFKLQVLT